MKLLILDGPRDPRSGKNPRYRGTHRAHPSHCDELPDSDEINKLFFWFLGEGGELGAVHDLPKALRFAELWNTHLKEKDRFEVVEVTDGNDQPQTEGVFIGFDLSSGYNNSLLVCGLKYLPGAHQLTESVRERLDLLNRQYAPQINVQGLFQTSEVASLCLRSMIALQDLSPDLFEGGDLRDFEPVGLHLVSASGIYDR